MLVGSLLFTKECYCVQNDLACTQRNPSTFKMIKLLQGNHIFSSRIAQLLQGNPITEEPYYVQNGKTALRQRKTYLERNHIASRVFKLLWRNHISSSMTQPLQSNSITSRMAKPHHVKNGQTSRREPYCFQNGQTSTKEP